MAARLLRLLINRLVPSDPTWVVVRSGAASGLQLLIDPKQEKFYWTGTHETAVQLAIVHTLKPGMTFWDIGAHIGFFSLLASRCVGDSGHIHAFEPLPPNRQRLLAAIDKNGSTNITVHDMALAATHGEALFYAHGSSLMWTLVPGRGEREGMTVPCCTLDEMAQSLPLPNLIKIDAEGAEVDILRSGTQFLAAQRPMLIVEFSNNELLLEAQTLLPSCTFERIAARHWLMR
ncbi:MAG TPA: FkbM family methyltransferase [Candidatus Tectomicrobia bacterium]|nr:FkbM family methyltransferase [Candidatus Tectomicrobia bacterium]